MTDCLVEGATQRFMLFFDTSISGLHPDFTVRFYLTDYAPAVENEQCIQSPEDFSPEIEDGIDFNNIDITRQFGKTIQKIYPDVEIKILRICSMSTSNEYKL